MRGPRPIGVSIIGGVTLGVSIVFSLAIAFLGVFLFGGVQAWAVVMREFGLDVPGVADALLTVIVVLFALAAVGVAVAGIAAGVGMLKGKEWARWIVVVMLALNAIVGVGSLLRRDIDGLLAIAVAGLVIWYLFQPDVRAWFRG